MGVTVAIFDIVRSAGNEHDGLAPPENIEVESVMSRNTMSVTSSEDMREAAGMLRAQRIGALPVIDDGKLVGIVARNDVLAAFITLSEG